MPKFYAHLMPAEPAKTPAYMAQLFADLRAGVAGGLRQALMMQSRITNEHIDRAIKELP